MSVDVDDEPHAVKFGTGRRIDARPTTVLTCGFDDYRFSTHRGATTSARDT